MCLLATPIYSVMKDLPSGFLRISLLLTKLTQLSMYAERSPTVLVFPASSRKWPQLCLTTTKLCYFTVLWVRSPTEASGAKRKPLCQQVYIPPTGKTDAHAFTPSIPRTPQISTYYSINAKPNISSKFHSKIPTVSSKSTKWGVGEALGIIHLPWGKIPLHLWASTPKI